MPTYPCVRCGKYTRISPKHFAEKGAWIICIHCQYSWDENDPFRCIAKNKNNPGRCRRAKTHAGTNYCTTHAHLEEEE